MPPVLLHIRRSGLFGADPVKSCCTPAAGGRSNFLIDCPVHVAAQGSDATGLLCYGSADVGLLRFSTWLLHFSVYLLLDQSGKLGDLWQDIVNGRTSRSACWDCCC